MTTTPLAPPDDRIAIIGMACRVPGAPDVETFWRNLVDGVDAIETLSDAELRAAGVPDSLLRDPRYVRAGGFVADADAFDAELFNCTPREAAMLDPQHRLLMECAWHALEHAGHAVLDRGLRTGVYAGVANSAYYHAHVRPSLDPRDSASAYQALIAGERDFFTTRLSYFFDLSGPSVNVQTACSTSLVAVHLACQALLAGECDMALAGGAAVRLPQRVGYLYEEGMILSRDGRCRPFDADASGTVVGNGAGMVVLRRLDDALADGDTVHAVILGSAVNNDGSQKVGYTAPSVEGQASVVREAQTLAGVSAESIGYVEAHGTGTLLGDPIEVAALTEAFRRSTHERGFCALGSVKSNIGHLDIAAGVVGLIKAALSVSRGVIPPSLHYRRANPALALETTPFFVPQAARPWPAASPRRAGVSSFGIGGTNAHVVLEAAEGTPPAPASRPWQVLCVSAKTPGARQAISTALAERLARKDAPALADVAYTLAAGRRHGEYRHAGVCETATEAMNTLRTVSAGAPATPDRRAAWVFPDADAAYAGIGQTLAAHEPVYRAAVAEAMSAFLAYPGASREEAALFAHHYGLAALWRAWGATPEAVLGIGVGEYAAALSAGVLPLADAARLIAARGSVDRFETVLASLTLRAPSTSWVSSVTGARLTGAAAVNRGHWRDHLAQQPRTAAAVQALLTGSQCAVLVMGPGTTIAPYATGAVMAAASGSAGQDEARAIAQAVATLWTAGVAIDWRGYYGDETRRRVPLPLYPFERTRRWIDAPRAASVAAEPTAGALTPRAYRTTWTRGPRLPRREQYSGSWLIVGDVQALAARLAERLERGGASVSMASVESLAERGVMSKSGAQRIVHLGATYDSLITLGRAIVSEGITSVTLLAVTEQGQQVAGDENVDAGKALASGPLRVLPQEHPEIACRNIDIGSIATDDAVDLLLAECGADDAASVVALRGAHRWLPALALVEVLPQHIEPSRDRPVYLVTGGLGLVGLALAGHLHKTERARLVLVGRSKLAPATGWNADDDSVVTFDVDAALPSDEDAPTANAQALAALQRAGAEIRYVSADVSDERTLRRAFDEADAAFGRVDVVIHAAGAPARESFTPFEEITPDIARRHFGPKVDGVEALRAIARERPLRACVLMSSLSSVLGGLGFAAYAAANAYLDAVARCDDGVNGVRWLSIGWDAWQNTDDDAHAAIVTALADSAIAPADGAAVFSHLLASGIGPHVLVSSTDLVERYARSTRAQHASAAAPVVSETSARAASTEEVIASTWSELLGVEAIRPDDDFYDLGGNSLLATQVVSRLRRAFGIELSVRVVFEENTVAGLARYVDKLTQSKAAACTP